MEQKDPTNAILLALWSHANLKQDINRHTKVNFETDWTQEGWVLEGRFKGTGTNDSKFE